MNPALAEIPFVKMHGTGNDFVLVHAKELPSREFWSALSKSVCSRSHGIGADGLLVLEPEPLGMVMFNPDGSESEMCGNGLRCFVKFAFEHGFTASPLEIQTGAGILVAETHDDGTVSVDMGPAELNPERIGMALNTPSERFIAGSLTIKVRFSGLTGTAVSMGNPHLVLFESADAPNELSTLGADLEYHPFFPNRTNVHFVQVISRNQIRIRTWERGAGATLACGTGACAAGVACFENGLCDREILIHAPGGDLHLKYADYGNCHLKGEAEITFRGRWLV